MARSGAKLLASATATLCSMNLPANSAARRSRTTLRPRHRPGTGKTRPTERGEENLRSAAHVLPSTGGAGGVGGVPLALELATARAIQLASPSWPPFSTTDLGF